MKSLPKAGFSLFYLADSFLLGLLDEAVGDGVLSEEEADAVKAYTAT